MSLKQYDIKTRILRRGAPNLVKPSGNSTGSNVVVTAARSSPIEVNNTSNKSDFRGTGVSAGVSKSPYTRTGSKKYKRK